MNDNEQAKYEILRRLALAGASGQEIRQTASDALKLASDLVGLNAAAMHLWNEKGEVSLSVVQAADESHRARLDALEEDLLVNLRKERQLSSAYLSFAGNPPHHIFTLPIQHDGKTFGAVIGLQEGERTVVGEDVFLETLSASIALNVLASGAGPQSGIATEILDKERLAAIVETAVTVNHEINNPLTAILGNVQLLLMHAENLDENTRQKLKVVEKSAFKIRDVTQRLLRITSVRSVEYVDGTNMLQLPDEETPEKDDSET